MTPLISVIVPTCRSAATIEACLSSVEEQTYPNIETVIVDSFSKGQNIDRSIHDPITYVLRKVYVDTSLSYLLPVLSSIGIKVDRLIADAAEIVILQSRVPLKPYEKAYQ